MRGSTQRSSSVSNTPNRRSVSGVLAGQGARALQQSIRRSTTESRLNSTASLGSSTNSALCCEPSAEACVGGRSPQAGTPQLHYKDMGSTVPSSGSLQFGRRPSSSSGAAAAAAAAAATQYGSDGDWKVDDVENSMASDAEVDAMARTSGLTVASLKHVRRKCDKLAEEKTRLTAEVQELQALLKEHRENCPCLAKRISELEIDLKKVEEREQELISRNQDLERVNCKQEDTLARLEAEISRLKQGMEEQLKFNQSSHENDVEEMQAAQLLSMEEHAKQLDRARMALDEQVARLMFERDEAQGRLQACMILLQKTRAEAAELKSDVISDAIKKKIMIHILAPKVTLSYNNAPPVSFSPGSPGHACVRDLVETEVTPHFKPLWAALDGVDKSPDGTAATAYADKILDFLTKSVKSHIERIMNGDPESPQQTKGNHPSSESHDSFASGGVGKGWYAANGTSNDPIGGPSARSRGSGSDSVDKPPLSDADKKKLLGLIRNGDDSGLDDAICSMMKPK